ncbi:sulfurtransferase, partial [Candidatus Fermentibacteria bacterium]|nr:sulfurtransferase [Candidatus Fermentibacteria bacterium]
NPCMTSCPKGLIGTRGHPVLGIPEYSGGCTGCGKCAAVCPGLAVTIVDFRKSPDRPVVTIPFELGSWRLSAGRELDLTDWEGEPLGRGTLVEVRNAPGGGKTLFLRVETDAGIAARVAGVRIQSPGCAKSRERALEVPILDEAVVCRCERVTAGEIRRHLRNGVRDLNELKALTRAGFGACGGKTCRSLLARLCREEGLSPDEVAPLTERPLFAETRLGCFSGGDGR